MFNLNKAIFKSSYFFDFYSSKKLITLILFSFSIIFLSSVSKVYSNEIDFQRFVLEDRNIKTVGIVKIVSEYPEIDQEVTQKFFQKLKNNNSNISFILLNDNETYDVDAFFMAEIKTFSSKIKPIHFSDFLNYEILENQLNIAIEIKIIDAKTNDLIWKRSSKKYSMQRWLDFNRQVMGVNPIYEYFGIPSQMLSSITKQYDEKIFWEKSLNSIVEDLSSNLVKINNDILP